MKKYWLLLESLFPLLKNKQLKNGKYKLMRNKNCKKLMMLEIDSLGLAQYRSCDNELIEKFFDNIIPSIITKREENYWYSEYGTWTIKRGD